MAVVRLKPFCTDYIWGGNKLRTDFGIEYDKERLAEAWVLSCHKDGQSVIDSGEYKGLTLSEYINERTYKVLGTNRDPSGFFPIITKLIDAKENLSIQVHPDNDYALNEEGELGKTEMWYIVDAEKDAKIYYGVNRRTDRAEMEQMINDGTFTELLNAVPAKAGDCFFIPAGTIHAICKGVIVAEVQQNSNVTYRVFDYNRTDSNGNKRELHISKALDVARCTPNYLQHHAGNHMVRCNFFTADILRGSNITDMVTEKSFVSLVVLSGEGKLIHEDKDGVETVMQVRKGESYFIDAAESDTVESYKLIGENLNVLKTQIGKVD
ncbi:MAG: class I mannose-6-phosphate isomerase [Clostridia bacterium]|nr:class I mannose-6-phosphate isomerase [Clostridia bacterium]